MRRIVVALHGIGFAKSGELEPALQRLNLGDAQVNVDANWNEIAAADYSPLIGPGQLGRLAKALNNTASLRPRRPRTPAGRLSERLVDAADIFFTLPVWAVPIATSLALTNALLASRLMPSAHQVAQGVGFYSAVYIALLLVATTTLLISVLSRASPLATARLAHVVIAAGRPWLLLAYGYLVITRRREHEEERLPSLSLAFLGGTLSALILRQYFQSDWILALVLIAFLALYVITPALLARLFAPALKLTLDILLYVSDENYRSSIQAALLRRIEDARGDVEAVELVVIGHSLGSVIGADFIFTAPLGRAYRAITLVTAGSPIVRLFGRLMPGHILPPRVDDLIEAARRERPFLWLNYYRRFDLVGARLGLPRDGICQEAVSSVLAGPLASHIGYWREDAFYRFLHRHLLAEHRYGPA